MKKQEKHKLAAPCGLYCGACSILLAYKRGDSKKLEVMIEGLSQYLGRSLEMKDIACEGCLSETVSVQCRDCAIRNCAVEKGYGLCAQCSDFPCQKVTDFNNDGMSHHSEVLKNAARQRAIGLDAWMKEQKERWRCTKCKCALDWYADQCPECGSPFPFQWGE